ncbi:MAG: ATP-grasp domain-containing protein [Planctomycetota bacterium]
MREKTFLVEAGVPVGPFAPVNSLDELHAAVETIGLPAVLKTAQMGYDGKGQRVLREASDLDTAWAAIGPGECILEAFIDFTREVSMLVARGVDGEMVLYGPIENEHANHILDVSVLPAPETTQEVAAEAARIATAVAEHLDAVGLICIELFQKADGSLLVNEIAPRPHNSGHLTIEGCRTSQFEQQVRAVAGLPLGSPESVAPAAMANLLGDLWFDAEGTPREPNWPAALAAGASLHLYGKESARPGRKMGHLTVLSDSHNAARQDARTARERLLVR